MEPLYYYITNEGHHSYLPAVADITAVRFQALRAIK